MKGNANRLDEIPIFVQNPPGADGKCFHFYNVNVLYEGRDTGITTLENCTLKTWTNLTWRGCEM